MPCPRAPMASIGAFSPCSALSCSKPLTSSRIRLFGAQGRLSGCRQQQQRQQRQRWCIAAAEGQVGLSRSSNLGQLQPVIEAAPFPDDPYGMQRVTADSFSSRGFYTDGASIASSLLLLVVLLALTFQRILGLDRFVIKALREWKEGRELERRKSILQARESLEEQWQPDNSGSDGDGEQQR